MTTALPATPPRRSQRPPLGSARRSLGAYYPPSFAAELMAAWTIRGDGTRVLEPSMGHGAFIRAANAVCERHRLENVELLGVEIDESAFERVVAGGMLPRESAILSDFLRVQPFPVDGIVGNPPYVRLRHLRKRQAERALKVAREVLGEPMETSGSLWMPFVLHATEFLKAGGRLAMVLPFDLTYVRYARPLWRLLGERFESLRVVRVRERIFSDILQEVVLLFADGYCGETDGVRFDAYQTTAGFEAGSASCGTEIALADIQAGDRPFAKALLSPDLNALLDERLSGLTVELSELARFGIGYVTGHKGFFHPSAAEVERHSLPAESLRPAVTSARQVRGAGIFTSGLSGTRRNWLFAPGSAELGEGERGYVAEGVKSKVHKRYKCRVRDPWWLVPGLKPPDLLVSVFSAYPHMLVNDAGMLASNSLLCGYTHPGVDPRQIVAAWYTPLTALQLELQVHSLGGGVFVLVPGEIARVRVPSLPGATPLGGLDAAMRRGEAGGARDWGRKAVLRRALGLSAAEIDLIEEGAETLSRWRTSDPAAAAGAPSGG